MEADDPTPSDSQPTEPTADSTSGPQPTEPQATEPVVEPAAEQVADAPVEGTTAEAPPTEAAPVTEPVEATPVESAAADAPPAAPPLNPLPEIEYASLAEALAAHEMEVTDEQLEQLDAYRLMLWDWNEKLNLTRHTTIEKFVIRDLFDTLQLSKLLPQGITVLDVGSGGGVPGLPLAILRPDLKVSVCESVSKKAAVLLAMVEELGLDVPVYPERVEVVLAGISFDRLIARAVAPLWKFFFWLEPHKEAFGKLLLTKGPKWPNERGEARHRGLTRGFDLRREAEYTTPGTEKDPETAMISTILSITASAPKKPSPSSRKGR